MDQSPEQLKPDCAEMVVLVPTRERPHNVQLLTQAFKSTRQASSLLCYLVDHDDPTRVAYLDAIDESDPDTTIVLVEGGNMVAALNEGAHLWLAGELVNDVPYALAFMGDDHRPRTPGWDAHYLAELHRLGSGYVYGNDLIHGQNLPTQIAVTSDIVNQLGWMAPPMLKHLFVDNSWLRLGWRSGCISYLPDTVVEHVHPLAGKAPRDHRYDVVNSGELEQHDHAAYTTWTKDRVSSAGFDACVDAIRRLRSAR